MAYDDAADPTLAYVGPGPAPGFDVLALFPAAWVVSLIRELTGTDPLGAVRQALEADWAQLHDFGEVLDHLAVAAGAVGLNVTVGNAALDGAWDGRAADTAADFFGSLGLELGNLPRPLLDLRDVYLRTHAAVVQTSRDIGDYIPLMVDAAVAAATAAAGAGLLAVTVVGTLLSGAAAAERTATVRRCAREIMALLAGARSSIADAAVRIGELTAGLDRVAPPSVAYLHPAAP